MKRIFFALVAVFGLNMGALAQDFLPANLITLDPLFNHHVLLVEKSTHSMSVFENQNGLPKLVEKFKVASGKMRGDKSREGDHKTPEGIYNLVEFFSDKSLKQRHGEMAKMYGAGAFTTDYPNIMDQRNGKSGSGIWLHSTDDASRIDKALDSKGCVVVNDLDLKQVSKYLDLPNTQIIIVQEVFYLPREAWEKRRSELNATVQGWASAWKEKRFNDYISFYHPQEFKDRSKGGYGAYKAYKQAVFSRPDTPKITLDSISILQAEDYAVVTLRQDYRSVVINDTGKKTLYLKMNEDYEWKIVAELWDRLPENNVAFTPSQRFFKE
ncbi:MAG: L,D-transpeptidase family protein [Bacteriovoracaceae bacterium]|nr:L,D-transpeptidase family protein [Bacteriovoracaceae bacterium]